MTKHKLHIDDGYGPTIDEIKERLEAGHYDHTIEPAIRVLVEAINVFDDMVDAMEFWLGSDSIQEQEAALVIAAGKAHKAYKLLHGGKS